MSSPRIRSVLFICAANTARSVMAEHLMRRELAARGLAHHIVVRSAGVAGYARDGALVSLDTRMALAEVGIKLGEEAVSTDLKRHPELLEQADLILAMTGEQAQTVREGFSPLPGRPILTLREFAGGSGDVEDPVTRGDQVFAACRDEIAVLIKLAIERLMRDPSL